MIVRTLSGLEGTERQVTAATWTSLRLVLARDGAGFSLHHTTIRAGTSTEMWYRHHVEAVLCVSGEGELDDLDAGTSHAVTAGTMYLLDRHDRHRLRARTDMAMVCVFNPPCTGSEVHDEEGSYPLLADPLLADGEVR